MPVPISSSRNDRRAHRVTPASINTRSQQSSSFAGDTNSGTHTRGHTPLLPPLNSQPLSSRPLSSSSSTSAATSLQQINGDKLSSDNESKENVSDNKLLSEQEIDVLLQHISSDADREATRSQIVAAQSRLLVMGKRRKAVEHNNVLRPLTLDFIRTRITVAPESAATTRSSAEKTSTSVSKRNSTENSILLYQQTHIYLDDAHLHDISLLASFGHITHLYLQYNQINDISCISQLIFLHFAVFHHNLITDIHVFHPLKRLQFLDISHNLIEDFDPVLLPEYVKIIKFAGNECCQHEQFVHHVIAECPYLVQLDDQVVNDELRLRYGLEVEDENADDQHLDLIDDDNNSNDPQVDELVMSSELKNVIDQMQNTIRDGMESLTNITENIRQHIEADDDDIRQNIQNKSGLIIGTDCINDIMQRIRKQSESLMQTTKATSSTLPSMSAYLELLDGDDDNDSLTESK